MSSSRSSSCGDDDGCGSATAEEREYGAHLARLDAADRAAWDAIAAAEGWDDVDGIDLEPMSDTQLLPPADAPAHEADLLLLASIDPSSLSDVHDRVDYLRSLDKVAGLVAALQLRALVALAGERPARAHLDEVHVEHEIAIARRCSRPAAGRALDVARTVLSTYPSFLEALTAGEISAAHAAVMVERTAAVSDPEVLARIERLALPKATRLAPGAFGREVAALVARFDRDASTRAARAREARRVTARQLDDGMGYLGLVHDWSTIAALHDAITTDAHSLRIARTGATAPSVDRDGVWEDATLDACRADAMAARMLGRIGDDGSITWDRSAATVEVQLVIDLDTLRHEVEHPCLLDGTPVPAALGRELAAGAAVWRRMVTDPVTGHLLDYGTRTYLPEALRTFVLARDGGCRTPGCGSRAKRRTQMDHAIPFPHGGSDAGNCGGLCTSHHQLKTRGYAGIRDSRADGSATWTTAWGQSVQIPPRRYLTGSNPEPPPRDAAPPTPTDADDPPPF